MRKFTMVRPELWQSNAFRSLPSDDARLAYLYLITGPHITIAGTCYLPDGYACADLRWQPHRWGNALAELQSGDLIESDAETRETYVKGWFAQNGPDNPKHLIGIRSRLERLSSGHIRRKAQRELRGHLRHHEPKWWDESMEIDDDDPDATPASSKEPSAF